MNLNDDKEPRSHIITHVFSTHGFKHFLKLNSQLLDVVDQDAGLKTTGHRRSDTPANISFFVYVIDIPNMLFQ